MIEITKESIDNVEFQDKHWERPKKKGFFKKLSKDSKIILYLAGTVAVFTVANITLIYSFYKILVKL